METSLSVSPDKFIGNDKQELRMARIKAKKAEKFADGNANKRKAKINASSAHESPKGRPIIKRPIANNCAIFSFFAGAGFLDLGFEKVGHQVVFVNEIHAPFLDAYKYARRRLGIAPPRFGYYHGDMAELTHGKGRRLLDGYVDTVREARRLVGFIGGPPCPDFSAAGKNLGRDGAHGKLSETYMKLIRQQKPDFFLFENVRGLWKTKKHRQYFEEIKSKLQKGGYITTECLKNALEYGIAQDRDRIILVGFRKELFPDNGAPGTALDSFPWSLGARFRRQAIEQLKRNRKTCDIPERLTVAYWFSRNKVSGHPNAKHHFQPHAMHKFRNIAEGDVSGKSFKRLHRHQYSPTAAYGNNEVHLHPVEPRRMSVAEALAIQSLPRAFCFPDGMSLSDMFKAIGNGVPFVPARALARSISSFLVQNRLLRKKK